ncbi:hypothetical protein BKN38_08645 [Helicobacter sp. CLO-3]|uniref:hypothetical protein n=1 Tax=unclassified Helicobacter TaxID=2593540 RepID=UPI000805F482|nr:MULTISPECIES: hypothetical protein [unclassified Helicobacter]OBV29135.1 hypothetical protein BA723_06610 [Helicobacter sp. CLO-3]OHU81642.1 hypothetical protein BKN38_08645 [Helicobacter sp. CLO-3]
MTTKEQINKIKDNAELAWAAYGYFDRIKGAEQDRQKIIEYKRGRKELDKKLDKLARTLGHLKVLDKPITLADILNIDYQCYRDKKTGKVTNDEFLGGDFAPNQAKRFFEKYDLLIHQPNTESGFSATLF